ncbi:DUF2244 domain-containing protein [Aquidulcibacter sp.]|jgi:uncharacterized membrane protein|uniref:DUF2244 domain-containing protein n=1 Tax=Aquidulcibacter sp. TaxID=2052990 RepID=UPI003784FB0E
MERPQNLWFDAEVRPNRALSPKGIRILFLCLAAGSIVINGGLILIGQWVAALFMAFDLSLLAVALLVNTRDLRAVERVIVDDDSIRVERYAPGQEPFRDSLSVAWARLERAPSQLVEGLEALAVTSRGKTLALARALSPLERAAFADALEAALLRRNRMLSRIA